MSDRPATDSYPPPPEKSGLRLEHDGQTLSIHLPRPGGAVPIGLGTLALSVYILAQTLRHYLPYITGDSPAGAQHPLVTLLGVVIALLLLGYGVQKLWERTTLRVTDDEVVRQESGPLGRRGGAAKSQIEALYLDIPPGRRSAARLSLHARLQGGQLFMLLDGARADEARYVAKVLSSALGRQVDEVSPP